MRPLIFALLVAVGFAGPARAGQSPAPPRGGKSPATPAAAPQDGPEYYFILGRHLEGEGKLDEAIAAHKQAIALAPDSVELRRPTGSGERLARPRSRNSSP